MSYDGAFPLPVKTGATGVATLTAGQLVVGAGTSPVTSIAYSTVPTVSLIVQRDSNANIFSNNSIGGFTTTAGAGGTNLLTAASTRTQIMTGTVTGQSFNLPNATTLSVGWFFEFRNQSSAATLTVKNNSASTLASVPAGGGVQLICTSIGSTAGSWSIQILGPSNAAWGSTDGLAISGPLQAGTLSQFRVDASGNTVIPVTGVMIGNGTTAVTASTVTQHDVLVGGASNAITSVSPSTSGLVLTSNGVSADPSFQSVGAAGGVSSITGNSGGAEVPSSGNFNILGTGSITVAGTANTETISLTGLTNHAIQIGAGSATLTQLGAGTTGQILRTNTSADPTWTTATYPNTTTINRLLYSSAANTITDLATANSGVLTTGATGVPVVTALASNGQLIIGAGGGGAPAAGTLTAGSNIQITNSANGISIAAAGATKVLLSTQNATTSASIVFTGLSSAYPTYELVFYNVYPETNAQAINLQFSTDGGANYIATNYLASTNYVPFNAITWVSSNTTTSIRIVAATTNTTTNISCSGRVLLTNFSNGGLPSAVGDCVFFSTNGSATAHGLITGVNTANTGITAFQVLAASGNILQGTFQLYGLL